ncbi:hypothetical protein BCAR13_80080 [Paraburkholderia caribensis]|nr:hypothetical protein BCAR13_80080 [Paraburkholderia caribensis]
MQAKRSPLSRANSDRDSAGICVPAITGRAGLHSDQASLTPGTQLIEMHAIDLLASHLVGVRVLRAKEETSACPDRYRPALRSS